jgi:hypothetical protein
MRRKPRGSLPRADVIKHTWEGKSMGVVRIGLAVGAMALSLLAVAPVAAETLTYKVALSPKNEVPPVPTNATGSADVTYDTVTRVVTWNITHSGLSGAPTAAHFHGPSSALENAPVIVVFSAPLASPFKGTATLTPDQATQLLAGNWYINIHTQAYPGGELRGQVPKK